MDQRRFFNACMSLMNIDMHELLDAGVIEFDVGNSSWKRFNDEPLMFIAKLDDVKRDALWALLEARQPQTKGLSSAMFAQLCAGLAREAAAWAGDTLVLPEDYRRPVDPATVARFTDGMRARLDRIDKRAGRIAFAPAEVPR